MEEKKTRNRTLDVLRAAAIYAVVIIHNPFPGAVGAAFDGLVRFAVPFFFAIAGYMCFRGGDELPLIKKRLLRSAVRLLIVIAFFTLRKLVLNSGDFTQAIIEPLRELATPEHIFSLLFLNWIPLSGHIWFMAALLYCYPLMLLAKRIKASDRALLIYASAALLIHQIYAEIMLLLGHDISIIRVRNAFFTGFPFFVLGYLIHKHEDKIREKLTPSRCVALTLGGAALTLLESALFAAKGLTGKNDQYFGSILICLAMLVFSMLAPERLRSRPLEFIGGKLTFYIYNIHRFIAIDFPLSCAFGLLNNAVGDRAFGYICPIAVMAASTAVSIAVYYAFFYMKRFFIRIKGPAG